ncbi:MAG: biopolymer transporter ExbD [Bacteroidales bacterium]|nr:biopolymer transporter ExbD [Lentimicrobiaceae bacterium]MDD5695011.1 biopolymer transporter ExbD [Bacteroidales bacterium]
MAEIQQDSPGSGQKQKRTTPKKVSTRIDFTPMVDLGFLLITFFMLTTTLIKPQTMEIAMPSKEKVAEEEQTKVKASRAITIILGANNKVFYYEGTRENDVDPKMEATDFSAKGIREYLIKRNYDVMVKVLELKDKKDAVRMSDDDFNKKRSEIIADKSSPIVLIKATDAASYKNLIDILDEMAICNIGRYAIVDITDYDLELLSHISG